MNLNQALFHMGFYPKKSIAEELYTQRIYTMTIYQKMDELLRKKTKGRLQKQPKEAIGNLEESDKNNKNKAKKKKRHFIF